MRPTLKNSQKKVQGSHSRQWKQLGLYDSNVKGWGEAFKQAMDRTIAKGGRIHFDLTDVNIKDALSGDPNIWVDRYTSWELQQIVRNEKWFNQTTFYLNGKTLARKELDSMGITVIEMHKPER
jgi:hypothetical protein